MNIDPALTSFLDEYTRRTNTHRFDNVATLIAQDATYWFTDGSYRGLSSIRLAFERTWSVIQEETYATEDVEWLSVDVHSATCIYTFHWRGRVNGAFKGGKGRGTSVLRKANEQWQVVHEHLSPCV